MIINVNLTTQKMQQMVNVINVLVDVQLVQQVKL